MTREFYETIKGVQLFVKKVDVPGADPKKAWILLHDALGSVSQWRNFPEKLAELTHCPVIAYDRQGHGHSDALKKDRTIFYLHHEAMEVLPLLLDSLGVSKPMLLGHSDGGTIALIFAAYFNPLLVVAESAHVFVEQRTLEGIRKAYKLKGDFIEKLEKFHGPKIEKLYEDWSQTWLSNDFLSWNIDDALSLITCPVMAIQGKDDAYGTANQVFRICEHVGDICEAQFIDQCGHIPHFQQQEKVLDLIDEFYQYQIQPYKQ